MLVLSANKMCHFIVSCGAPILQLLAGAPAGSMLSVFDSDAAAHVAHLPKLPRSGERNILVGAADLQVSVL